MNSKNEFFVFNLSFKIVNNNNIIILLLFIIIIIIIYYWMRNLKCELISSLLLNLHAACLQNSIEIKLKQIKI